MNKKTGYILFVTCCAMALYGCHRQQQVNKPPESTFSIKGSVREMNIYPDAPPNFPEHDGKTEFVAYCSICHSLKYIAGQPRFPAKIWEAEVNKMVVKYHAPIDSATCKKIIAYLVAVKSNS